jgi:hypothetical protein
VPTLEEILDVSTLDGFERVALEDHGLNIIELDTSEPDVVAVTERGWAIELAPPAGARLASLTFPTSRVEGAAVSLKRYADADIVEAEATAAIAPLAGPTPWWWLAITGAAAIGGVVTLVAWVRRRRLVDTAVSVPVFTMPREVTPVSALSLLRRIQVANGEVLGDQAQARLAETIDELERHYFAPIGAVEPKMSPDLERVLREWIAEATA